MLLHELAYGKTIFGETYTSNSFNSYPKFIVFEGIDFSGKDTQMEKLAKYLNKCVIVNTISKGLLGKTIRKYLAMEKLPFDNITMASIFTSELSIATGTVKENLNNGYHVIANRWFYSTIAYNCDTFEEKEQTKLMNANNKRPDYVIYLDIEPRYALERRDARSNKKLEVFETEDKLTKVYENYKNIFMNDYKDHNVIFVNANQDEEAVRNEIITKLSV